MRALPFLVGVPVTVEEMVEDQSFDFTLLNSLHLSCVAVGFGLSRAVAFGIDVGGEQYVLAVWRPQLATGLCANGGQLRFCDHRSCCGIELRDTDLRAAVLRRQEREALAIWRPAGPVGILIGDEGPLGFWRLHGRALPGRRGRGVRPYTNDPNVRRFAVRG